MGKGKKEKSGNPAVRYYTPPATVSLQDHQKTKSGKNMKNGRVQVEVRGQTWVIEPGAIDDVEMFEMLDTFGEVGSMAMVPKMLTQILGVEQKQIAYEMLRDPATKRVSFDSVNEFMKELFNEINPN